MDYFVDETGVGDRLDSWLTKLSPEWSRSQVAKLIKAGTVKVDGAVVTVHYALRLGQKVTVPEWRQTARDFVARPRLDLRDKVVVLAETKDYVVVEKPAGMIVHYPICKPGQEPERNPALVDWLVEHYPGASKIGDDPSRPGIVHRLDKQVSGVIVMALTEDGFADLKRQFKKRLVEKRYQALVHGAIIKDSDVINFPLVRSTDGSKMAAKPFGDETSKIAISEFTVLQRFINYTFLEVLLKTGRTHQIRAHLAAYGHPVVGDSIYGTATTRRQDAKLALGRVFLASCVLGFTDLNGEPQRFERDIPKNLKTLLSKVK